MHSPLKENKYSYNKYSVKYRFSQLFFLKSVLRPFKELLELFIWYSKIFIDLHLLYKNDKHV